jgi:hypothetical protein
MVAIYLLERPPARLSARANARPSKWRLQDALERLSTCFPRHQRGYLQDQNSCHTQDEEQDYRPSHLSSSPFRRTHSLSDARRRLSARPKARPETRTVTYIDRCNSRISTASPSNPTPEIPAHPRNNAIRRHARLERMPVRRTHRRTKMKSKTF